MPLSTPSIHCRGRTINNETHVSRFAVTVRVGQLFELFFFVGFDQRIDKFLNFAAENRL